MITKFKNIILALSLGLIVSISSPLFAQLLHVPIIAHADGDLDVCAYGEVEGLNENGDGFLAVRTGPGTDYVMIDELNNGEPVWMFDRVGQWIGIIYATDNVDCSPLDESVLVETDGKKGWVHERWITLIAG